MNSLLKGGNSSGGGNSKLVFLFDRMEGMQARKILRSTHAGIPSGDLSVGVARTLEWMHDATKISRTCKQLELLIPQASTRTRPWI